MKPVPVILVVVIAIATLTNLGCKKGKTYMNTAVITGFDLRTCACCGGLLLNFNGDTHSYEGNYFLVSNTPSQLGITDSTTFPVYMQVDWVKDTLACLSNTITITRFVKQ